MTGAQDPPDHDEVAALLADAFRRESDRPVHEAVEVARLVRERARRDAFVRRWLGRWLRQR